MVYLIQELWSPYLVAPSAAWLISQLIKYGLRGARNHSLKDYSLLYHSGGMPSAHSAVVVALTTVVGLYNGLGSGLFSVTLIMASVVMYDATNVRRAVGEQGRALRGLYKAQGIRKSFFTADGHTLPQVIAGAILGVFIGFIVYKIML